MRPPWDLRPSRMNASLSLLYRFICLPCLLVCTLSIISAPLTQALRPLPTSVCPYSHKCALTQACALHQASCSCISQSAPSLKLALFLKPHALASHKVRPQALMHPSPLNNAPLLLLQDFFSSPLSPKSLK